jgi:hypothetical protein
LGLPSLGLVALAFTPRRQLPISSRGGKVPFLKREPSHGYFTIGSALNQPNGASNALHTNDKSTKAELVKSFRKVIVRGKEHRAAQERAQETGETLSFQSDQSHRVHMNRPSSQPRAKPRLKASNWRTCESGRQ